MPESSWLGRGFLHGIMAIEEEGEAPWRVALSTLMGSHDTFTRTPDNGGLKDAWYTDDSAHVNNAPVEKETKSAMHSLRESLGGEGVRQSGDEVDWLVGNHAAMMHGSPSILESLSGYGVESSQVTSRRDGVTPTATVQKDHARLDHSTFASLKGATTAYDSVKDQAGKAIGQGDGIMRHPAAIMPSMDDFFLLNRLEISKGDGSSIDGTGGHGSPMIYDPMHANNGKMGIDASRGSTQPVKYNNRVIVKRAFGSFAPATNNVIQDHSLNISGSSEGIRQKLSHSPSPSFKPPLELEKYLSEHLCDMYYKDGMPRTMYEWQATCLTLHEGILNNQKNLVVSAPTSSGKTLIAEILMLRAIANDMRGRKVLFILPYVALCDEKARKLAKMLIPMGRELKKAYGSEYSENLLSQKTGIIVCTPENANSIVNRMIDANVPVNEEICCVVVDELHLVAKDDRGALLEILISKLRYHANLETQHTVNMGSSKSPSPLSPHLTVDPSYIQFIGLTATLPNINNVGNWLGAITYSSSFRPVPLLEHLKIGNELFIKDEKNSEMRILKTLPSPHQFDPDHIGYLAKEAVDLQKSVMIFCSSKNGCKVEAERLAKYFGTFAEGSTTQVAKEIMDARNEIASKLSRNEYTYTASLSKLVLQGIAFHHGDLSMDERKLIEEAVRQGYIKVLCATSTLGTGVNLPIYRVIFRDAYQGQMGPHNYIRPDTYRQISGRAGRTGIDRCGESFLITRSQPGTPPKEYLTELITGNLSRVESSMSALDSNRINRFVLEMVTTSPVPVDKAIMDKILQSTLLMTSSSDNQSDLQQIYKAVNESLIYLSENHSGKKDTKRNRKQDIDDHSLLQKEFTGGDKGVVYKPTGLGKAIIVSGMDPEEAILYLKDLNAALTFGFIMGTPLHAAYLCVPMNFMQLHMGKEEYEVLYKKVQMSDEVETQVLKRINLDMAYLTQCKTFGPYRPEHIKKNPHLEIQTRICTRIYVAYIFEDLIHGMATMECMKKYNIKSGRTMEDLRDDVCRFAAKGSALCERLKNDLLGATLRNFGSQVWFGTREEVIKLASICRISPKEAWILYNAGIESPDEILQKSVEEISSILLDGSIEAGIDVSREFLGKLEALAVRIIDASRDHLSRLPIESLDGGLRGMKSPNQKIPSAIKKKPVNVLPSIPQPQPPSGSESMKPKIPTKPVPKEIVNATVQTLEKTAEVKQEVRYPKVCQAINSGRPLGVYLNIEHGDVSKNVVSKMPNNPAKKRHKLSGSSISGNIPLGIAFSWEDGDEYIKFEGKEASEIDSIIQQLAESFASRNNVPERQHIAVIDWKRQYPVIKEMFQSYEVTIEMAFSMAIDVVICAWMLDTDSFDKHVEQTCRPGSRYQPKFTKASGSSLKVASDAGYLYKVAKSVLDFLYSNEIEIHYKEDRATLSDQAKWQEKKRNLHLTISSLSLFCMVKMLALMKYHELLPTLMHIEMPICNILGEMEHQGLGFDQSFLIGLKPILVQWKNDITRESGHLIGKNGNLGSHKFVKEVIFQQLKYNLPKSAFRHSPGKNVRVSVDKQTLNDIHKANPEDKFIPLVLKYRKLEDTIGTIDSLLGFGTSGSAAVPTIHAHFLQTNTATGRLAMDNPNLQCLPKVFSFEIHDENLDVNIRKSIIPKLSTRVILSADFRHIELRVMAHLSSDRSMIRILKDPESDPFKRLACEWLQIQDESDVTDEQRQHVKHLTYALLYGMGETRLGQELNTSAAKAKEMKRDFLHRFPDLSNWIENLVTSCRSKKHIATLCNRIRWLDNIDSPDSSKRAAHERAAVNSVCQGSAADIAKLAMIKVKKALGEKFGSNPPCSVVLQVHDELLFEVEESSLRDVALLIKDSMETAYDLSVPIPVSFHMGKSWGEMEPYDPVLQSVKEYTI